MKKLLFILSYFSFSVIYAQTTIEQAIELALAKNHQILIAKNNLEIIENNNNIGNKGFLPKIDANAGVNYSNTVANLTFAGNNPPLEDIDAVAQGYNANVALSYLIFNGGGRLYGSQLIDQQSVIGREQLKLSIESTIMQVANIYFEAVKLQDQINIIKESLIISKERLKKAELNYTYGVANKLDVLNAEVDFFNDSTLLIQNNYALNTFCRNLNTLLGLPIETNHVFATNKELTEMRNKEEILQKVQQNNTNLLLSQMNISVQEINEKVIKSGFLPTINLNANYGYNYSESNASIVLNSSNLGLNSNIAFTWNLFDGTKKRTSLQNAKITLESNQLKLEEAKLIVEKDISNTLEQLEMRRILLQMEQKNIALATLNFERTKDLFQLGKVNSTQFREAQLNLLRAKNNYQTQLSSALFYEYEIKRMCGELISE
jgi:outer membrane protein